MPSELRPSVYHDVTQQMLFPFNREALFTAAIELEQGAPPMELAAHEVDTSFDTQMQKITEVAGKPDAYLFTANSAIPVADSVRGYYDELGEEVPYLDYVEANRVNSRLSVLSEDEIVRLQRAIEGMGHVCIVDQYVQFGDTIKHAGELVRAAAHPTTITGIRGRWYTNAEPYTVDREHVTSTSKEHMHKIGTYAANRSLVTG